MTEEYTTRAPLDDLRATFNTLGLQQKAEFVLEAAFTTFATGVEAAGRTLSRELDDLFAATRAARSPEPERRPSDEAAPGAAEAASPPLEDL